MKVPRLIPILPGAVWMTGCGDIMSLESIPNDDNTV